MIDVGGRFGIVIRASYIWNDMLSRSASRGGRGPEKFGYVLWLRAMAETAYHPPMGVAVAQETITMHKGNVTLGRELAVDVIR